MADIHKWRSEARWFGKFKGLSEEDTKDFSQEVCIKRLAGDRRRISYHYLDYRRTVGSRTSIYKRRERLGAKDFDDTKSINVNQSSNNELWSAATETQSKRAPTGDDIVSAETLHRSGQRDDGWVPLRVRDTGPRELEDNLEKITVWIDRRILKLFKRQCNIDNDSQAIEDAMLKIIGGVL